MLAEESDQIWKNAYAILYYTDDFYMSNQLLISLALLILLDYILSLTL